MPDRPLSEVLTEYPSLKGDPGATGPAGPAGPQGNVGPQGLAGATGSQGPAGVAGPEGKTVRSGSTAPAAGLGVDGDFYINTTANTIYGPKAAGAWGSPVNLVGPQGPAGADSTVAGPQGPQGIQGVAGPTGPATLIGAKLAADHSNATITPSNAAGLSFSGVANKTYLVGVLGSFTSSATTIGIGLALTVPAGAKVMGLTQHLGSTAQTMSAAEQVASGAVANAGTVGVRAANTELPVQAWFLVVMGATAGAVQLQTRAEVAGTVVLKAGSLLVWQEF